MGKSRRLLLSASAVGWRERALGAVRPGVEALLLAAVAFGCAQAGWTLLTPGDAGARNTTNTDDQARTASFTEARVVSPFAPEAGAADGQSHAVAALLSSVQLNGVRTAADPARSGAVLTLSDGGQRAFAVGAQIVEGVTLANVGADYVVLSYAGGQRQVALQSGAGQSWARAMMGLAPAPAATPAAAPAPVAAAPEPKFTAAAAPAFTGQDAAWLQKTLAQVEEENGRVRGWRVAEPAPQALEAAGLRGGDVIVSINGAGPESAAAALASAQGGRLVLGVERGAIREKLTIEAEQRT